MVGQNRRAFAVEKQEIRLFAGIQAAHPVGHPHRVGGVQGNTRQGLQRREHDYLVRRTTRSEFDHLTQVETMQVLFEVFEDDALTSKQRCTWRLRHTSLWELELLLKVSGLRPITRHRDFEFDKPLDGQPPFDRATDDFAFIIAREMHE